MIELEMATENYVTACRLLAEAEPEFRRLELITKIKYGLSFGDLSGGVKEREMGAFASKSYQDHIEKVAEAQQAFIIARERKRACEAEYECARSMNSMERMKLEKNIL